MNITFDLSKRAVELVESPQKLLMLTDNLYEHWGNYNPYRNGRPLSGEKAQECIKQMNDCKDAFTFLAIQNWFVNPTDIQFMRYCANSHENYIEVTLKSARPKCPPREFRSRMQIDQALLGFRGPKGKTLDEVLSYGKLNGHK